MTQTTYILHGAPGPIAPAALPADPDHVRWDGADPATTHTIRLANASEIMGREIRAYIQIEITGRAPRPGSPGPTTRAPGSPWCSWSPRQTRDSTDFFSPRAE